MSLAKKLKLHRITTVLKYLKESWGNSKFVHQQSGMNRILAYFSLLYWFYFYGNDFNDYCTFRFWNLSRKEKKSYISLRRNDKLRFATTPPDVYQIFLDKIIFNQKFSKYINRRWIEVTEHNNNEVSNFMQEVQTAIFKPKTDFGGHGIRKIANAKDTENLPNGILEECIQNSASIKKLAPGSLNTVRIVTFIDKSQNLHILAAVMRMGNGTAFTDNYHDGGIACAIDVESGCLLGNAFGMSCKEYSNHPYSNITFNGYHVDGFSDCLKLVRKLAFIEPRARYVGWDFAITPDGVDVIEGNIPPGEDITQIAAGRGLWNDIIKLL